MNNELIQLLVCPETHLPIRWADASVLRKLNDRIEKGEILNRAGHVIRDRLESGLIREDGRIVYPVRNGLPIMLVEEAIVLD